MDHHLIARTKRISLTQTGDEEMVIDTDRVDVQTGQPPLIRLANLCTGPSVQLDRSLSVLMNTVQETGQERPDWIMWQIDEQIEGDDAWLLTLQTV
jgi:hypothetical protein